MLALVTLPSAKSGKKRLGKGHNVQ